MKNRITLFLVITAITTLSFTFVSMEKSTDDTTPISKEKTFSPSSGFMADDAL